MKRISMHALGCKVNQVDARAMLEQFVQAGYTQVPFGQAADVALIGTCTVTGMAERKSRQILHKAAQSAKAVVVAGCLAQREAQEAAKLDGVRLVIGNARRGEIVSLLHQAIEEDRIILAVEALTHTAFESLAAPKSRNSTRAMLKIQEGCDNHCAYCIIPSVRGPARSMSLSDVTLQARSIAAQCYEEVVLTGIHLMSYGKDIASNLEEAIAKVADAGIPRLRLGSLEPPLSEAFLAAIGKIDAMCPHFHLSLQSGSEGVLARMGRRYSPSQFADALVRLREIFPGAAVTTDIICGFPGETRKEFMQTLEFVKEMAFSSIHVFPFSAREGTQAATMADQIPEDTKHQRACMLIALGKELEERFLHAQVGQIREVLFEKNVEEDYAQGYTREYIQVLARGGRRLERKNVLITAIEGGKAIGNVVE